MVKKLKKVANALNKASKLHKKQSKVIKKLVVRRNFKFLMSYQVNGGKVIAF